MELVPNSGAMDRATRFPDAVSERIFLLRLVFGYTQGVMARAVGISQTSWALYERGLRRPNYPHLAKIQQITGATPWWIMDGNLTGMPGDLVRKIDSARHRIERDNLRRRR